MNKYFHSLRCAILLLGFLLSATNLYPCTIIAVGKKASADGSVIISHTDCGADCRIRVVHGQTFKQDALAPVHWGIQDIHRPLDDFGDVIGHIPQVEKTYTYFHSAYPHMNEHQLAIANWSIIKEVDKADSENFMVSTNYKQFAIEKGWYDPSETKPFVWQDVYAPIGREWATSRLWLFYSTYAPGYYNWPERNLEDGHMSGYNQYIQYVEPLSIYPTSVRPEKKISVQDVIAFQRSTFEGTIYDKTEDYDWYVPDGQGGMKKSPLATPFPSREMRELLDINNRRNVARPQGYYGMIAQLRDWLPDPIGGIYWVFLDNAYTSANMEEVLEMYNGLHDRLIVKYSNSR